MKKTLRVSLIAILLLTQVNSQVLADDTNTAVHQPTQAEIDAMRAATESAAKGDPASNQASQQAFDSLPLSQKKDLIERKLNGIIEISRNPENRNFDWNSAISTLTIALQEIVKLLAHGQTMNK